MLIWVHVAFLSCSKTPTPTPSGPTEPDPVEASGGTAETGGGDTTPGMLQFASGRTPKNLLMVSIDTLRADHLSGMPFLWGKGQEGWSMTDTLSCANWTQTATACAMGGRSTLDVAEETGVFVQTGPRPIPRGEHPDGTPFLADWLGDAGFYSILVTANPIFGPDHAQAKGFDEAVQGSRTAPWVVDNGLALLGDALAEDRIGADQPWYLHLHFFDPHAEYTPPAKYLTGLDALDPIPFDLSTDQGHGDANTAIAQGLVDEATAALVIEHMRVRYVAETRFLDDTLAEGWASLEAGGYLDDTLVVVWTDHGEQFYEHGRQTHANLLHFEENDAAWFFWADGLAAGSSDRPAALEDIAPTILDLYGIDRPVEITGARIDDIVPDRVRFTHVVGKVGPIATATGGAWKIHWAMADPAQTTEGLVSVFAGRSAFHRATDPEETKAIWDDDDAALAALWADLEGEVGRMEPFVGPFGFQVLWID